jgi:hypothetical protein
MVKTITYGAVFAATFIWETALIPYYEMSNVYYRTTNATKKYFK